MPEWLSNIGSDQKLRTKLGDQALKASKGTVATSLVVICRIEDRYEREMASGCGVM
jgi:hypothetical protein